MSPIRLRVKELRAAKKWTQQDLAEKAGVTRATVNRIESDRNRRINYDVLEAIADAFGVDPGFLFERITAKRKARSDQ